METICCNSSGATTFRLRDMTTWKTSVSTARTKKKISAAKAAKSSALLTASSCSYPARKPRRYFASHASAPNPALSTSGRISDGRSARRMAILLAPRRVESKDVLDADQDVHHAEAGDEAAHERIAGQHRHGGVRVQQRIHRPHPRPRDDDEEDACFQAVEGKEEGTRQAGIVREGGPAPALALVGLNPPAAAVV